MINTGNMCYAKLFLFLHNTATQISATKTCTDKRQVGKLFDQQPQGTSYSVYQFTFNKEAAPWVMKLSWQHGFFYNDL